MDYLLLLESLGFNKISNSQEEIFEFVHNIRNNEHCILVFKDNTIRDKIVNEFFNPKFLRNTTTAVFTHELTKYNCDKKISYDELVENNHLSPNIVSDFLMTVLHDSYQRDCTRIACEDSAWFSDSGFYEEHQKLGNNLDSKVLNESVILCCYNASKMNDSQLKTIFSSRNYVLLEEPFSLYIKNSS